MTPDDELSREEQAELTWEAFEGLTKRELEVLYGLLAGKGNKEIADDLRISHRTVEVYRAKILSKFNAANTIRVAVMLGRYMPEVLEASGGRMH